MMPMVDLVFSGSGTLFPAHLGALCELLQRGVHVEAVGGTSGGSVVAAAHAFGVSVDDAMAVARKALSGDILDPVWRWPWQWRNFLGAHHGRKMHALVREVLPGKMGDAETPLGIWVVDLETREPVLLSSWETPEVDVADAVSASMAIFPVFEPWKIGDKLYMDGGFRVNFGTAMFDDLSGRTVGIRFAPGRVDTVLPDPFDAMVEIMLDNANRVHRSRKAMAATVTTRTEQSGFDFSKSDDEIDALFLDGVHAARKLKL